jgi:hypothetical protein
MKTTINLNKVLFLYFPVIAFFELIVRKGGDDEVSVTALQRDRQAVAHTC